MTGGTAHRNLLKAIAPRHFAGRMQAANFLDLSQLTTLLRVAHGCWLESRQARGGQHSQGLADVLELIALHIRLIADMAEQLTSFLASDFVLGSFGCGADSLWRFVEDILHTATDAEVLSAAVNVLQSGTQLMSAESGADALEAILGVIDCNDLPDAASSARFAVISTLVQALEASNAFAKLFIGGDHLTARAQAIPSPIYLHAFGLLPVVFRV
jgi:hypothetical protein